MSNHGQIVPWYMKTSWILAYKMTVLHKSRDMLNLLYYICTCDSWYIEPRISFMYNYKNKNHISLANIILQQYLFSRLSRTLEIVFIPHSANLDRFHNLHQVEVRESAEGCRKYTPRTENSLYRGTCSGEAAVVWFVGGFLRRARRISGWRCSVVSQIPDLFPKFPHQRIARSVCCQWRSKSI